MNRVRTIRKILIQSLRNVVKLDLVENIILELKSECLGTKELLGLLLVRICVGVILFTVIVALVASFRFTGSLYELVHCQVEREIKCKICLVLVILGKAGNADPVDDALTKCLLVIINVHDIYKSRPELVEPDTETACKLSLVLLDLLIELLEVALFERNAVIDHFLKS